MRSMIWLGFSLIAGASPAAEVTVKNDSFVDFSSGILELGFVAGEKAASWLTSPCDGSIVAAQVLWMAAPNQQPPPQIEDAIEIYRSGTFPTPGALAETIGGPQMTAGVINEFRYLDENNTIPLSVPVNQNETFVLAFTFGQTPGANGPSTVIDSDGIQPNRNAIYGSLGGGAPIWFSNSSVLVNGDWVIRAVVNCGAVSTEANVSTTVTSPSTTYTAGSALQYTLTISNAGPAGAPGTNVVDIFPAAYTGVNWACAASGGATCTASGSGNLTQVVGLPSGGQLVYTVNGTVNPGTTGTLSNSATAIVNAPATDPNTTDNTATLDLDAAVSDVIFANGFDSPAGAILRVVPARALGRSTR